MHGMYPPREVCRIVEEVMVRRIVLQQVVPQKLSLADDGGMPEEGAPSPMLEPHHLIDGLGVLLGDIIEREDIDPDAEPVHPLEELLPDRSLCGHDLDHEVGISVAQVRLEAESTGCPVVEFSDEALIVGTEHPYVYIVIPWYVPLVAYRPQKGAIGEIEPDAHLGADARNLIEHAHPVFLPLF